MSGETEAAVSGWTVDTLREHMQQTISDQRQAIQQQIKDDRDAISGRIVDNREMLRLQVLDQRESVQQQFADLRVLFGQQVTDMRTLLNERYDTQTKALDAAFKAAEQAVQTALVSAEKAVGKAETAADKRFESVNEFRKQLADQTATFPTRIEMNSRLEAVASDTTRNTQRISELELRLTSRLDRGEGTTAGAAESRTEHRLDTGQLLQMLVTLAAVITLAIVVFRK